MINDCFIKELEMLKERYSREELLDTLNKYGVLENDYRIKGTLSFYEQHGNVDLHEIKGNKFNNESFEFIKRVLAGDLVVPEFDLFSKRIESLYSLVSQNKSGNVADYIPQLSRVNPEYFGVSVCTIDGQRYSIGDTDRYFALQSVSKVINYALALELNGEDKVHQHVGREPSGLAFNSLSLNHNNIPHNPMINAGAIMTSSLIKPHDSMHDRLDLIMKTWQKMMGGQEPIYNDKMYKSEKKTADRNFALFYFMREHKAFAEHFNIDKVIDLYFKSCSIEVKCADLAIAAATLANSGICPFSNDRVFESDTVKDVVSLMSTCGMYDFSGEYFFKVGVPTKSGVSGALMLVIPNVMGISIWSPRLDDFGNSVRGVEFCEELVKLYNLHIFDGINRHAHKLDPRRDGKRACIERSALLCSAAKFNDISELKRLISLGVDVNTQNFDGRTALHVAIDSGSEAAIKFLLDNGANRDLVDRWGNKPAFS